MKIPECNLRNIALLALGLWALFVAELYACAWIFHAMPNAWYALPTLFVSAAVTVVTAIVAAGTTSFFLSEATHNDEP